MQRQTINQIVKEANRMEPKTEGEREREGERGRERETEGERGRERERELL